MDDELLGKGFLETDLDIFQREAHRVVDWISDYLRNVETFPVRSEVSPGAVRAQFPAAPPECPESLETLLDDVERRIVPGLTHWNSPGFMGYFGITGSPPGILGELLAAAFNVNAMLWCTSPAATELEEVTLDWLRQMLGLPDHLFGVIYDTASISTLCGIAAAREAAGIDAAAAGLWRDSPLRLYTSAEAHSSVEKAAITLGIGHRNVRKVPVDASFSMDAGALRAAIREDRAAGFHPFCVTATVGTTSTTSIDPVAEVADICEQEQLWLHVDAAYGGSAAILPEMRWVLAGCDRADSIVINPHKWLFVPIDCSCFFTRHPSVLKRAFSLVPAYLETDVDDDVVNFMDYGPQLGRRFRALKLWIVIRTYGVEGLRSLLRRQLRLAQSFASWIDNQSDFERLAPTLFSTVCFRAHPNRLASGDELDRLNRRLLDRVNRRGEVFLSHTIIDGHYSLRLAIGNMRTGPEHVERAQLLLLQSLDRINAVA